MDDFFVPLNKDPIVPGLDDLRTDLRTPLHHASKPVEPSFFPEHAAHEHKSSESGQERKKRPLVRDAMLRDAVLNDSRVSHGMAKLPEHFQVPSGNSEWSSDCPSFMSPHSWRGIHSELQKDLKMGEWAYSSSSKEMWWSVGVSKIFEQTEFTQPSFEIYRGLLHPDDRDQVFFLFQRAIQRGIPYDVTHRLYLPNKTIKWCRCMCRIQFHAVTKRVEKLIGTIQDISSWAQSIKTNILVETEDKEVILDEDQLEEDLVCTTS